MASARTAQGPNLATLGQRARTNDTKLKKLFSSSGRDLRGLGCPLSPKDARTIWGADNEWGSECHQLSGQLASSISISACRRHGTVISYFFFFLSFGKVLLRYRPALELAHSQARVFVR